MIKRASFATFLPLALFASGCGAPKEGVLEKFNFFPIARYEVSEKPDGYTVDALWPLVNVWRAGEASGSRALPIYLHEDDGDGERFTNVLALYWQTLNDDGSTRHDLFPLWHSVRNDEETATRLWPLYGVREYGGPDHPYRSDQLLWPLYSYDRKQDGTWRELGLLSIWPLFALFRREDDFAEDLAYGDSETQIVSVFDDFVNVASLRSSRFQPTEEQPNQPGAMRNQLSLLEINELFRLWGSDSTSNGGPSKHDLLNLFDESRLSLFTWDDQPASGSSYRHLFPLWFQHESPDSEGIFLLPLFGRSRDGSLDQTWILPPLLGMERDPSRELSAIDILYPLIRSSTEGSGADEETHFRALPLAWFTTRKDSSIRLLLPLYYDIEDEHSRYQHFIPFYGKNVEDDGATRTTFVLAPLFVRTEEDATSLTDTHILFPLIEFESSDDGRMSRVFPLYYSRTSARGTEEQSHLNLLVLFDRQASADQEKTVLYPLFASTTRRGTDNEPASQTTSLLPLLDARILDPDALAGGPSRGDETSVLFPLSSFRDRGDGEVSRWIFPFYWQFDDPARARSTRHLWPLLGREKRDTRTTWSTLWPFFSLSNDDADPDYSEFGYLFPLGFSCSDQDTTKNWLLPLWYHHREGQDSTSWFLWPLFHKESSQTSAVWHSLFFLLRSETTPASDEFSILYALYRGRTEGDKTTRSVPFLFHYEDDAGAKTLRLFHLIPIRW